MIIEAKCACGAEIKLDSGAFINGGGVPDENGFVYLIELRHQEWKEEHLDCKYLKLMQIEI